MEEFNFIVLLVLLISVFFLHSKLNRIENLLKKTLQKDDEKITVEPPEKIATPISPVPEKQTTVEPKIDKSEKKWNKFCYWFCYGIHRDGVSKEYAAATTWLSRAGILILLCAVGFFLKYSIENNLISPTVRIIITFLAAIGMFAAGLSMLNKRFHIPAIGILSAGIVTFYMGAFAGFKLYQIIPVRAAFAIMVLATIVSMLTAVKFNLLSIALIGCAGGYLTPVMLSNNSGNLFFLLTYIVIISAGVLIASRVYRWRSLEVMAFVLSYIIAGAAFDKLFFTSPDLRCVGMLFANFIVFSMIPVIRKKTAIFGLTEWLLPILSCALTLLLGINMIFSALNSKYENFAAAAFATVVSVVTLSEGIYLLKKRTDGSRLLPAFLAASIVALITAVPLAIKNEGAVSSCYSWLAFVLIFSFSRSKFKTLLVLGSLVFAAAFFAMMSCPHYVFDSGIVNRFFRGGMFTAALLAAGFVLMKNQEKSAIKAKNLFFAAGGIAFLVYTSVEVFRNLEKCKILHDFRHGGLSVWWAVLACILLIAGIRKNYRVLRASSLLLFIACLGKIYMLDIAGLNTLHKVIAFLLTGILFLGGAAAYIIFRKRFPEVRK